ncbi:hypothetical protein PSYPI_08335, partial [Pseudomonas syringae pv. pisi str. 1704B]
MALNLLATDLHLQRPTGAHARDDAAQPEYREDPANR